MALAWAAPSSSRAVRWAEGGSGDQLLEVVGPDVLLPGSEQFLGGLGRLLVVIGLLGLLVVAVVRRLRSSRGRRRPTGLFVMGGIAVVGALLAAIYWPPPFSAPRFPALPQLLPDEAFFYRPIIDLPVAAESADWIASQRSLEVRPGFTGQVAEGVLWGMPFNLVDDDTGREDVALRQSPESSYPGPYPIADPPYIEEMPTYGFDMHYLALDLDRREAWELISARVWFGRWEADAGAHWSMDSLEYPTGRTIAAGLPLLPGTITYAEVDAGRIDHAVLGATPVSGADRFIWPARGTDGRSTDPSAPPMGAWMRLRADVDLSDLGPQARVIAEGLQRHGLILSDTAPRLGIRGTPDARWDRDDLATLARFTTDDFEFVDASSVMVSETSMEARPAQP